MRNLCLIEIYDHKQSMKTFKPEELSKHLIGRQIYDLQETINIFNTIMINKGSEYRARAVENNKTSQAKSFYKTRG